MADLGDITTLKASYATRVNDNTSNAVTPADVRGSLDDTADTLGAMIESEGPIYAETNALNAPAVEGYSSNGGEGVRGESTTGSGVEGIATTGTGLRGTNASTTNPTIHTNNTDATNAGPLVWHHNADGDGLEVANDGSLAWTTANGAFNTMKALVQSAQFNTQSGSTYATVDSDVGKTIRCTAECTVTINHANVRVYQAGTGQVTLAEGSGITFEIQGALLTARTYAQYTSVMVLPTPTATTFEVCGTLEA